MASEWDQSPFVNEPVHRYKSHMAMRYIYRRQKPEQWQDLQTLIPGLENQLGSAFENSRRFIKVSEPNQPLRYSQYTFLTRKAESGLSWICTSVELVAEDEAGLFALTEKHHIPRPSHLKHVPG